MPPRKKSRTSSFPAVELFLLLIAFLPHLVIAFGNPNTVLDWYSSDDGFYYFQVARNLASGLGFSFDGLTQTNGFHPLWLFVITPLFALAQSDVLLPLRLLVLLSALLSGGSAILLYRILRRLVAPGIAAFTGLLWIILPRIHNITLHSGVEAGLNAFCILLFWHALVTFTPLAERRMVLRQLALAGIFGMLAILSRLDNVFLVAFGGLWLWLRLWSPPAQKVKRKGKENVWAWRFSTGFALFAPIAVVMLLYLAWNHFAFGTLTPVSGQVKLWWGTLRNTVYGFPVRHITAFVGQFFTDHSELGPWSLFTAPLYAAAEAILALFGQGVTVIARRIALFTLGALLAAILYRIVWRQRALFAGMARGIGLLPFFAGCFAHIVYYKASGSVAQQPWYWVAQSIFLLLLLGLFMEGLRVWYSARWPKFAQRIAAPAALVSLALLAIVFLVYMASAIRAPGSGSNHYYLHRPAWLEEHTEPGARIAITGAGNLAYFIQDRTIVNMDGLISSVEYFEALKAERGAEYLASLGVDYIFGNEYILTETNPYAPMLAGHLEPYELYIFGERELPLWRFVP
jgi:hypothetical protein